MHRQIGQTVIPRGKAATAATGEPQQRPFREILTPVGTGHGALARDDEEQHIQIRLDMRVHASARRQMDDIRIQLPPGLGQLPRDSGGRGRGDEARHIAQGTGDGLRIRTRGFDGFAHALFLPDETFMVIICGQYGTSSHPAPSSTAGADRNSAADRRP
ncbi:hypothetical protein GCM10010365_15680 [Streptomyces poonensis]|uniref:Uncharacterized protein n=1 Tax=Streptomyces poonensis TaxID=68255 RepID=A0A918PD64_9ACTN|nr:hypothetical protein GCM10010365_15680 [Streptomyces poonensis]